jgi:NAD(P)-dependent dehydrogenase (short-subunit alcohol dehydrogenase family)
VVSDIDSANAQSVGQEILAMGEKCFPIETDVSSETQVERLIGAALVRFTRIDILVNNAGIVSTGPLLETTVEMWERVHAINLKGVFLCTKAVFPTMISQKSGRIINIASVAGKRGGGFFGNTCYSSSKGGVIAFTKGAAREAGPYNITVNAIAPAMIETDMISAMPADKKESLVRTIPLGRTGSVEDVASAVCFLASDGAGFITGEIMDVDGGLTMD